MNEKILIVEDQFIEANNLQIILEKAEYRVCTIARNVPEALLIIEEEKPDLVLLDILLDGELTGIDLAWVLKEKNIAFIYLSANSNKDILESAKATKPYGFLVKPFRKKDVLVALNIAHYLHEQHQESLMRRESGLSDQLNQLVEDAIDPEQNLLALIRALKPYLPVDFMAAVMFDENHEPVNIYTYNRIGYDEYQRISKSALISLSNTNERKLTRMQKGSYTNNFNRFYNQSSFNQEFNSGTLEQVLATTFGLNSLMIQLLPLTEGEEYLLLFFSKGPDVYHSEHPAIFNRWKTLMARSFEQIKLREASRLVTEIPLDGRQRAEAVSAFKRIVGSSHAMLNVLDQIMMISKTHTTVLVLGESGTGKERIVDAIHQLSSRNRKPLIKVNCAALPEELIESELFGHEKGAFTGATERRVGKFEQADGGTLFLDEIGEMPYESQVKLLRALQEKEIERVGGIYPIKINVRIIAATNRNLEQEVAAGKFRMDLYYRLHVFPIFLPSLKDRKDDIPELVRFFLNDYNKVHGKQLKGFSSDAMEQIMSHTWPGNIRELEHFVERSVLLNDGHVIERLEPFRKEKNTKETTSPVLHKSLEEIEAEHILAVLESCNGRISGRGGAAEILGLNVSTLNSRLKKLGISKEKTFKV